MTWMRNSCFVTLALLLLWRVDEMAEACTCIVAHPQQAFCNSDVVMRAKVVRRQEVDSGDDGFGNSIKMIKYTIKQIKVFKGPKNVDAIYTAPSSAICGATLDAHGKEYLITGRLDTDGTVHVTMCGFLEPWETLTATQKKNLDERYQMGCSCKITRCTSIPCTISSPAECLWTDGVTGNSVYGEQAKQFACIKRSDGSCAWYRGSTPPGRDFLEIQDP